MLPFNDPGTGVPEQETLLPLPDSAISSTAEQPASPPLYDLLLREQEMLLELLQQE